MNTHYIMYIRTYSQMENGQEMPEKSLFGLGGIPQAAKNRLKGIPKLPGSACRSSAALQAVS